MSAKGKPHPKDKFTPAEDAKLKLLVKIFGVGSWNKISASMGKRNARQCRDRYKNYLSPNVKSDPWTAEEDSKLEKLVETMGKKWSLIAKEFNGRTDINIKSRYALLQRQKARESAMNQCTETQFDASISSPADNDMVNDDIDFDLLTDFDMNYFNL